MKKLLIFDLDGTLVDSLPDIDRAIDQALQECGYDLSFDYEGSKFLIGNGADILVHRALGVLGKDDPKNFQELKAHYMPLYAAYQGDHTKPFPGEKEAMLSLKAMGYRLAIASNKPDAMAKAIVEKLYGKSLFDDILGQRDELPPKPNPVLVEKILKNEGMSPADALYVGDSLPDIQTAENAKMEVCLCLWGYGRYEKELLARATYLVHDLDEFLALAKKLR